MKPSSSVRRFRALLILRHSLRGPSPSTVLTVAALVFLGVGFAWTFANPGVAFLAVGVLLSLLTPIGAALRILLRGK